MNIGVCAILVLLSVFGMDAKQHKLVIIIPSYNNAQWYEKNLQSVFMQKDDNYHVFYIDDASTDGTGDLVQKYVADCGKQEWVTLVRNERNQGALANIYHAVHNVPDDAIVVTLDGDDWLYDDEVFSRINSAYQNPEVWMTYGQFVQYPSNAVGFCRAMPENVIRHHAYREYDWIASHLRTFYAGLFKRIKLQDLLDEDGAFFSVTWDMAFMFPMLEMAGNHALFIPEKLYVYNQTNPLNDFRKKFCAQIHCDHLIRSRQKYQNIQFPFAHNQHQIAVGEVIISKHKETAQLQANSIALDASEGIVALQDIIDQAACTHILLMEEGVTAPEHDDLIRCAQILEQTGAHAFYFGMRNELFSVCKTTERLLPGQMLTADIFAWQFKHGSCAWRMPYQYHCVLYRAADIAAVLKKFQPMSMRVFFFVVNQCWFDMDKVGLLGDPSIHQLFSHKK